MSEYWKKQVFRCYDFLNRLSRRRFPDPNTAEEAMTHVIKKLGENDWKRARGYKGESSFKTYIGKVTARLLEDFSREKFGRIRPPTWMNTNPLWKQVWKMLCLERMSADDVTDSLTDNDPFLIEEAITLILSKIPDCGAYQGEQTDLEEDEEISSSLRPALHHFTPDEISEALEFVRILETLGDYLFNHITPAAGDRLTESILQFCLQIKLTSQERMLLRLVYQEGYSVSEAGRMLKLNSNQAHSRHKNLLKRIQKAARASGLETELKAVL